MYYIGNPYINLTHNVAKLDDGRVRIRFGIGLPLEPDFIEFFFGVLTKYCGTEITIENNKIVAVICCPKKWLGFITDPISRQEFLEVIA